MKMKIVSAFKLALLLLFLAGCNNQPQTPQQQEEPQTTVQPPKVDLHSAVVTDDFDAIRQHIQAGSDLNVLEPSRSSSPLITAAAMNKTEAAKMLIDAGADLNYRNADGSTALHTAIVFDHRDLANTLIDEGADLNIKNNLGSTPLHTAAFFCRTAIVETLLAKGADKSIKNADGKTALESVAAPFNKVKGIYDAIGESLRPLGVSFDYDFIKTERPKIAAMLK